MKNIALFLVCLLLAGGCARTTYVPGHNLDGRSDRTAHTLLVSAVAPDGRTAAIDGFLDANAGKSGLMTIVHGSSVPEEEIAAVEAQISARVMDGRCLVRKKAGDGTDLSIVYYVNWSPFTALDTYWFSNAAVSPDFGRSTQYNLASQAARPEHLRKSAALGPANPQGMVGPVERYQSGQVRELQDMNLTVGGGSSSNN